MWTKPNLAAVPFAVVVGGVPLLRRGGLPLVLSLAACPLLRSWIFGINCVEMKNNEKCEEGRARPQP